MSRRLQEQSLEVIQVRDLGCMLVMDEIYGRCQYNLVTSIVI